MATTLKIMKRHDTARTITDQLLYAGAPVNLTGASVSFLMRSVSDGTAPVIKKAARITNAAEGRVIYTFLPAEIDEEGKYLIEWEVVFGDGRMLTVPDDSYHQLQILSDLG